MGPAIPRALIPVLALLLVAAGLGVAWFLPGFFWLFLVLVLGGVVLALALACPVPACVFWLFAIGLTPDMWVAALLGGGSAVVIVAALKVAGLVLVVLAMARYGPAWDGFNPGFAFSAMFCAGLVHGLHPNLDPAESFRTLLGSIAPFAFGFVRLPGSWSRAVIGAVLCIPLASVMLGAGFAAAGLRPLLVEGAGLRLQGAGHPAFLGGFALAASCAALLELLRSGRARYLAWLVLNLGILLLSGARAPLAVAAGVVGLALLLAPAPAFPWPRRIPLLLGGGIAVLGLLVLADTLGTIRIFTLLGGDSGNLSGRDEIWPLFQAAWDASPWWGWGVGAGKLLVAPETLLARLLGTTAAHNEYLRIGVDGGYIGLALLVVFFVLWAIFHLRALNGSDRWVMTLVLLGFAVHSATDNTLIATTSSVLFAWVIAVFARPTQAPIVRKTTA